MLKSSPKFLTILFLLIFIFQLVCLIFIVALPQASQAAEPATFKPQIEIPGLEKEFSKDPKTGGYILPSDTGGIAKYVRAIYKYAIGIVGILAAVVLMVGGVMWIMAGGSATMIGEAKAWIGASLTGLTLALLSYLILATVNPALVELRTTAITPVAKNKITVQGCCVPLDSNSKKCTTGEINNLGKDLCLADDQYNSKPCNEISQCEQFMTNCSGSNDGEWCDQLNSKVCANGRCETCSQETVSCGMLNGLTYFCCPGLRCDGDFFGHCVQE